MEKVAEDENSNKRERKMEVVVCGGGVIGVCTAYYLAKMGGASVTIIEKSSTACAASGKSGGFLALDWLDDGPLSSLARASFDLHRSLSIDLDGPTNYGYRPLRTLSVDRIPSDPSTSSSSSSIIPNWVDGSIGNVRNIGTVETTAQVHPLHFTHTILSAAVERYGVEVLIGEAKRVEFDGHDRATGVWATLRDIGSRRPVLMPADAVVLALGPWSGRFPLLSGLFRISGRKVHSIVLRPKDPEAITPDAIFLNPASGPNDPRILPRPTGEVYICGFVSEEAQVPDDPEEIVGTEELIRKLHEVAEQVSSRLGKGEGVGVEAEQACFLPCTDDELPVIGEMPYLKGCFVATGHGYWGILNGPATGAALAELVLDGHAATTVNLALFSPERFFLAVLSSRGN